ncbi:MAG: serine aminopeptidase domain-containing protein [Bacteroidota bacterium]
MPAQELRLTAADGTVIAADVYLPPGERSAAILVAPAMGVPRRFYRHLCTWLSEYGYLCLALDYRGIGGSAPQKLRGYDATILDWVLDLNAAHAYLRRSFEPMPHYFLGHSIGAQLIGLMEDYDGFKAHFFIATGTGAFSHFRGPGRNKVALFWKVLLPTLVAVYGYLPGWIFGSTTHVPGKIARQWRRWGLSEDYLFSHIGGEIPAEKAHYDDVKGEIIAYTFTDDYIIPRSNLDHLLQFYPAAEHTVHQIAPQDVKRETIGHMGFFFKNSEQHLWPVLLADLQQQTLNF